MGAPTLGACLVSKVALLLSIAAIHESECSLCTSGSQSDVCQHDAYVPGRDIALMQIRGRVSTLAAVASSLVEAPGPMPSPEATSPVPSPGAPSPLPSSGAPSPMPLPDTHPNPNLTPFEADYIVDSDNPLDRFEFRNGQKCCKARLAECMACQQGITADEFCAREGNDYITGCGASSNPESDFDCGAGYDNWEDGWSDIKKGWCCTKANRGCGKFDCTAGLGNWELGWSEEKKVHCCNQTGRTCGARGPASGDASSSSGGAGGTAVSGGARGTDGTGASGSAGGTGTAGGAGDAGGVGSAGSAGGAAGAGGASSSSTGGASGAGSTSGSDGSTADATSTSAEGSGDGGSGATATATTATNSPFDCTADFAEWERGWSEAKKAWCCSNRNRGCVVRFDCTAGTEHKETGWSEAKKTFCSSVGSGGSHANQSGSAGNSTACVTREDARASSMGYTTSPPGTPCVFGHDDRDEGAHCIMEDGKYGSFGWCWTDSNKGSWGSCSETCPLFGPAKVLAEQIVHLRRKLAELTATTKTTTENATETTTTMTTTSTTSTSAVMNSGNSSNSSSAGGNASGNATANATAL